MLKFKEMKTLNDIISRCEIENDKYNNSNIKTFSLSCGNMFKYICKILYNNNNYNDYNAKIKVSFCTLKNGIAGKDIKTFYVKI